MKIFPYLLLRVTALPLDYLELLNWPGPRDWQRILNKEQNGQNFLKTFLHQLSKIIGNHPDYKAKNSLANLYRDIQKQRRFKAVKYEDLLQHNEEALEFYKLLQRYEWELINLEKSKLHWQELYDREMLGQRATLNRLLRAPALLRGLPMSSISVAKRLQRYLEKPIEQHRKKERQTERTALQFLSRIATKTSPFSSYTTLSLQSIGEQNIFYVSNNTIRLNNYILRYFQDLLEALPGFNQQLLVKVNPSIRREETKWTFLFNSRNIESIQEMAINPVVEWVLKYMQEKRIPTLRESEGKEINTAEENTFSFGVLQKAAAAFVEAEPAEVYDFLIQLIDLGLLEWDWGISGTQSDWLTKLRDRIEQATPFEGQEGLLNILYFLEQQLKNLLKASAEERPGILQQTQERLQSFFSTSESNITEAEEEAVFRKTPPQSFHLKAEQIFYEDESSSQRLPISQKQLFPFLDTIQQLISLVYPISLNTFSAEVRQHYSDHYPDKASVDLLTFYNSFYRQRNGRLFQDTQKNAEIDEVLERLKATANNRSIPGAFRLAELQAIFAVISPAQVNIPIGPYQGAMLHFAQQKGGSLKAFVEANFMGYGKMMGRFAHLFPKDFSDAIYMWNMSHWRKEELWVENVDASFFNANLHPRFVGFEVASPGSQNLLSSNLLTSVNNLEVVLEENTLLLRDKYNHDVIRVFNFGFEALENRSSMYQLLQSFAYQVPSLDLLTQLLDTAVLERLEQGVYHLPRLVVEERLLLKRERWYFPAQVLPQLGTGAGSEADFFLAVQRWRLHWNLPAMVFMTLMPRQVPGGVEDFAKGASSPDDYKPQYIAWENPLLIQLLGRLWRRAQGLILIEEMWPLAEDSLEKDGLGVEVLVEWGEEKKKK